MIANYNNYLNNPKKINIRDKEIIIIYKTMEAPIATPNEFIKTLSLDYEGTKITCKIQTIKDFLSVYLNNTVKYEGYIHISKIQNQIFAFVDYNIGEIFEVINSLNNDSFSLIKEQDILKLKIKLKIF